MRASTTRRLVLAAAAALTLAACNKGGGAGGAAEGEMSLGKADAPVTVIEYASVTCSHCAAWNEEVFPEFKKKYVDTGQVRYVFREFLTPPENVAAAGFLLARCAGDDKYFQIVDTVMRSQQEMARTQPREVLLRIARSAGMSEEQFTTCLEDEAATEALQSRVERYVRDEQIASTPTFVIGGQKHVGAQSMAKLDAAIQPLLKK